MPGFRIRLSPLVPFLALLAILVLFVGCERGQRAVDVTDVALEPPASQRLGDEELRRTQLPPTGEAIVRVDGGSVTVLAKAAPCVTVLRALEGELGFELVLGDSAYGRITVRAVDVTLDRALEEVLAGRPYALHYRVDPGHGGRVLSRVAVGRIETEGPGPVDAAAPEVPRRRSDASRILALRGDERDPAEIRAEQDESIELIADPDPLVRAEAVEWMYIDERGVAALFDVIANDPDGSVRLAAAEALSYADDEVEAVDALLLALRDSEPDVVIAALDAIEYVGDSSVIPKLTFLFSHPSREVRERTIEAVEWLED
jgi:hypothetical protein